MKYVTCHGLQLKWPSVPEELLKSSLELQMLKIGI
jgi:hypothetical protein